MPASELWAKLTQMPRPSKPVDFPRKGDDGLPVGQLAMRVLTQEEVMICKAAAEAVARKHIKEGKKDDIGYEALYTDAVCVEILFQACRDAEHPERPAFPGPKAIREMLSTDECGLLFQYYLTVSGELGPTEWSMSNSEAEAWIDRLVEGGSAYPLDSLSSDALKMLTLYMAFQLRSLPKDSSSASGPPEEPTPSQ